MSHKDDLDELIVKGQELLERSTGEAREGDITGAGGHHWGRGTSLGQGDITGAGGHHWGRGTSLGQGDITGAGGTSLG